MNIKRIIKQELTNVMLEQHLLEAETPEHFGGGENIDVYGYQTQHFDICKSAVMLFTKLNEKNLEGMAVDHAKKAAEHIDNVFGVEKEAVERGSATSEQVEDAIDNDMLFGYELGSLAMHIDDDLTRDSAFHKLHVLEIVNRFNGDVAEAKLEKEKFTEPDQMRNESAPGYKHDCAVKVLHKEHGEGTCIPEKHTLVKEGNKHIVTHYDVKFKSGKVVEDISIEDLKILTMKEHWHKGYKKKKKKSESALGEGKIKMGSIVIAKIGPHKGEKHEVIHDFGNGKFNIKPMGFRNKYRMGAAGAGEKELKLVKEGINEAKFSFTQDQVKDVAELIAKAIGKMDKSKTAVHDMEYDAGRGAGFEISMGGDKYEGGSYVVRPNGEVYNAAIGNSFPNAVYAKIGDTDIRKVMKNIKKFESVNESDENYRKSLEKIARDRQLKMLSKKDKETLLKIADLMKKANEGTINVSEEQMAVLKEKLVFYTDKKGKKRRFDTDAAANKKYTK